MPSTLFHIRLHVAGQWSFTEATPPEALAPSWPQLARTPDVPPTRTATRWCSFPAPTPPCWPRRGWGTGEGGDFGLLRPPRTSSQPMLLTWSADGGLAPVQLSKQKNRPGSHTAQQQQQKNISAAWWAGWMRQRRLRRRRLEKAALAALKCMGKF